MKKMNKQEIQRNNKTKTTLIISVIILALMIAGTSFWYYQIIRGSQIIREDKKVYNQELKDSQFISEIKREKEKLDNINNFLGSLYVPADDAVSFIEYIEDVSSSAGVSLDIDRFDINGKNVVFSVSAEGSWNQINRFIVMMENLPYYTIIENLNISVNNAGGNVLWQADFDIKGLTK
jgi:hypothetical protein